MAIAIGTFVTTLAIVVGIYWLFVGRVEMREERTMRQRMAGTTRVIPAIVKPRTSYSSIGTLDRALVRLARQVDPLRRLIDRANVRVTPAAVLLASALVGAIAFAAARMMFPLPVQVAAGLIGLCLPVAYLRHLFHARVAAFEAQFPDAIDLIARSLRAGHALTTAMELVSSEAREPIGREFRLLFERQNYGMSLDDALKAFAERVPLIDAKFFVTAVLTQREVGGNLAEVLERLSAVIRERFTVKREIRVASAHGRITAWVLGLMAPVLAMALYVVNPDNLLVLTRDPIGVRLIFGAVFMQLVGVLFIKRIVNVEY
jgi:tight adherence protein B